MEKIDSCRSTPARQSLVKALAVGTVVTGIATLLRISTGTLCLILVSALIGVVV